MHLEDSVSIRLTKKLNAEIEIITKRNPDKYENISHFVRCACFKLLREEWIK